MYGGVDRRKRPDLRRDCEPPIFSLVAGPPWDGKDLIYEGIASFSRAINRLCIDDGKDLIYEGIASPHARAILRGPRLTEKT